MASREKWRRFGEWFNWVIREAEIYDYGRYPVQGLGVWMPYGFQLRRRILDIVRRVLDSTGHEEVLFPLLIPEDLLKKEAEHIRGFEGEVYWVTHGGETPLGVRLALRPTSETAISYMESFWINSYKQLPKKYYQIVSIFRYETKATRAMIRLREVTTFKEAHTLHADYEDAERQVLEAIEAYKRIYDEVGIPYIISKRPDWDKFAGALYTIAFDTVMPDGRVLQIGTVHNLGQNFTKVFDVKIQLSDGSIDYGWQTSYGISDRLVATVIGLHGDDRGAVLPPNVAPIQIVIVPIPAGSEEDRARVVEESRRLGEELRSKGFRVKVDDREELTPGAKFYYWELRGVPVRLELGPREIRENRVTIARRDTLKRETVDRGELPRRLPEVFDEILENIRKRAWEWLRLSVRRAETVEEAAEKIRSGRGVVEVPWCGSTRCGLEMEERSEAKALGSPLKKPEWVKDKRCPICGRPAVTSMRLAKTY